MKKIGILYGKERSFPMSFVETVNGKNIEGIIAEPVRIDKVIQGAADEYAVIIDRISQDVPFYRAYLKNAAISGAAVINNPFLYFLRYQDLILHRNFHHGVFPGYYHGSGTSISFFKHDGKVFYFGF